MDETKNVSWAACYVLMFNNLFRWITEHIGDQAYKLEIVDNKIDIGYGRYSETNYYLAFNFKVDEEPFHMRKEVSAKDYKTNLDFVRIRYSGGHPYQVSIRGYNPSYFVQLVRLLSFGDYNYETPDICSS